MSRRKQAKPRSLKREVVQSNDENSGDTLPLNDGFGDTFIGDVSRLSSDSDDASSSSELENIDKYRCRSCRCMFEGLTELLEHLADCIPRSSNGGAFGTATPPGSLRSLSCTPDDTMSDTPGSSSCCPTPSSSSGGGGSAGGGGGNSGGLGDPDTELAYTLGVTENTPYGCQFCDKAFPRLSYLKRHEQVHSDQMPFRCEYCHRLFKHKRSRDRHVKLHTGDRKYRCTQCESAFSRSDHLKIHMKTHDNGKPYQCTVCNRGYNTAAALSSHMQNHKKVLNLDVRNSSMEQGKTLGTLDSDLHHIANRCRGNSESPEPQKPIICNFCPHLCSSPGALRDHVFQNHQTSSPSPMSSARCQQCREEGPSPNTVCTHKTEPRSPSEKSPSLHGSPQPPRTERFSPGQQLTCGFCSRSDFHSLESLQLHVQVLHLPNYHDAITAPSVKTVKRHPKSHQTASSPCNTGIICDLCGQSFTSLSCLQKHNLTSHNLGDLMNKNRPGDIYCSQCNICFTSSAALLDHVHFVHESNSMNHLSTLSNTNKRSISSARLRHNGAKQLKSSLGMRNSPLAAFNGISSFYKRPQGNTDGADFGSSRQTPTPPKTISNTLLCNQCNAAFQDFESFRTHLKNHLDEAAGIGAATTRRFSCPECEMEFDSERILDCHIITHFLSSSTEYGCQSCLKLFQKPDDLQKHLLDIHAQHLYRCALCKQLFDSKVSIQVHFAVKHSNECRSFKCISCGAYFRTELEFQVHVKVSHLSTCHTDSKPNQPFRCLLCDQVCSGEAQLRFHVATHKKPFPCSLCTEAFHVEFLLDRHVQAVHQQNVQGRTLPPSPSVPHPFLGLQQQKNAQPSTMDSCNDDASSDVAQNLTVKRTNSNAPMKTETKNASSAEVSPMSPEELTTTAATATTTNSLTSLTSLDSMRCELCDLNFSTEASLNAHRRQVHNLKPQQKSGTGGQPPVLSLFCAYCNESCKSRHDLENHMKGHTGTPTRHKCNICDELCPSAATLAEHKLTHCKVVSSSTCIVCRLLLSTEDDFMSHMQQHNGPSGLPGPCVVCRQTLVAEVEVKMHAKFHTRNSSANFQEGNALTHGVCCVCSRQFEIGNLIIRALTKSSSSDVLPHTYMCKECFHSKSDDMPNVPRCNECGVKFESETDLESHRRCVHHMRSSMNGKTYQCIKCQTTFESEAEIQAHVTCHVIQEGTDHECKLCRKVLDSPSKLQCHLIEHTFEGCPSFTCYMCSSVFTGAHLLQQHMLEHGLDARPYDCTRCHHKFYFRAELENHTFVHQLEYQMLQTTDASNEGCIKLEDSKKDFLMNCHPYKHSVLPMRTAHQDAIRDSCTFCKECKIEFPSYVEFQRHTCCDRREKTDSSSTERSLSVPEEKPREAQPKYELNKFSPAIREKKHECPFCPKRFTRRENMRIHMRAHHDSEDTSEVHRSCPHCGKTFVKRSALKEHIRTHITSTMYPCEKCQESFSTSALLRQHESNIHGREFEHECSVCGDLFAKRKTLDAHMNKVHPKVEDCPTSDQTLEPPPKDSDDTTTDNHLSEDGQKDGGQNSLDDKMDEDNESHESQPSPKSLDVITRDSTSHASAEIAV